MSMYICILYVRMYLYTYGCTMYICIYAFTHMHACMYIYIFKYILLLRSSFGRSLFSFVGHYTTVMLC